MLAKRKIMSILLKRIKTGELPANILICWTDNTAFGFYVAGDNDNTYTVYLENGSIWVHNNLTSKSIELR